MELRWTHALDRLTRPISYPVPDSGAPRKTRRAVARQAWPYTLNQLR
jgi:hypothetical protein